MKKDISLIDLIDYLTVGAVEVLKKIGKLVNNKNSHDIVYIFTKVLITFCVIALLDIPFTLIKGIGVVLIYTIGDTFRQALSTCWGFVVYLSYFLLSIVLFLKVFDSILKDKELNLIEQNRRKDVHAKKKVFLPIISFLKVCLIILTIPLFLLLMLILIIIGMNICLIVKGYGIFSTLFMIVGVFIMILSTLLMIINIKNGGNK